MNYNIAGTSNLGQYDQSYEYQSVHGTIHTPYTSGKIVSGSQSLILHFAQLPLAH